MRGLGAVFLTAALAAAACTSGTSALEEELTTEVDTSFDAINEFIDNRQAQIERSDMQNPNATLGEFLTAGREAAAVVDFAILNDRDRSVEERYRACDGRRSGNNQRRVSR